MAGLNQAICIGSSTKTRRWLENCLNSFGDYKNYPIIVVVNDDFELGKLSWVFNNTRIDEVFLLHDTMEIKDTSLFDIAFREYEGWSYALSTTPVYMGMYLGKYRREVLNQIAIPVTTTKKEAVDQEVLFNIDYANHEPNKVVCDQPLEDGQTFEDKFGRTNMVLENKYVKKYKATWSYEMVEKL